MARKSLWPTPKASPSGPDARANREGSGGDDLTTAVARGLWPASLRGQPDRIRLGGDEFAAEEEELEPIEWWRWFQEFDRRNLQLIYDPSKGWFTLGSRLAPSGS